MTPKHPYRILTLIAAVALGGLTLTQDAAACIARTSPLTVRAIPDEYICPPEGGCYLTLWLAIRGFETVGNQTVHRCGAAITLGGMMLTVDAASIEWPSSGVMPGGSGAYPGFSFNPNPVTSASAETYVNETAPGFSSLVYNTIKASDEVELAFHVRIDEYTSVGDLLYDLTQRGWVVTGRVNASGLFNGVWLGVNAIEKADEPPGDSFGN